MKINGQENPQYTKFEKILMTQKFNDAKTLWFKNLIILKF